MTAPRIHLFQLQHPEEAAFLLGLVERPLEGTVWQPAGDSSGQGIGAAE